MSEEGIPTGRLAILAINGESSAMFPLRPSIIADCLVTGYQRIDIYSITQMPACAIQPSQDLR
jgi:hypothetical protein